MKIIDKIIAQVSEHRFSGSSEYLAIALASACNARYKVSLLDASVKLDTDSKQLLIELMNIAQQPDFSNADQDGALRWLRDNKFIE
jgi:hypothetical protein